MAVDETAWVAARRLYTSGVQSIAAIASETGVSVYRLRRRVKVEGWVRARSETTPKQRSAKPRAVERVVSDERVRRRVAEDRSGKLDRLPEGSNVRAAVVNRLYRAIDTKLKRLEFRMQSGKTLSAADSERETRELGTMVRSFEKVTELAADLDRSRQPAGAGRRGDLTAADAERMRREIAERLERLAGGGNAT